MDGRVHNGVVGAAISPLKNAIVAFFNLAKCRAKLVTARKTATWVAVLASHPCDAAARSLIHGLLWVLEATIESYPSQAKLLSEVAKKRTLRL
jgi:hypothetical protein